MMVDLINLFEEACALLLGKCLVRVLLNGCNVD